MVEEKMRLRKLAYMIPIKDIREFTYNCLDLVPDYFWTIPASSSGKYHPSFAQGKGGLVRHTEMAFLIAKELCTTYELTPINESIALSAVLLHDSFKYGKTYDKKEYRNHSYLPKQYLFHVEGLNDETKEIIFKCIGSHMGTMKSGKWNPKKEVPTTILEQIVHLSDYIASRKFMCYKGKD